MTDIVATETAKAREQAERLIKRELPIPLESIVTALLEAKADVLTEAQRECTVTLHDWEQAELFTAPIEALQREARARRARGL